VSTDSEPLGADRIAALVEREWCTTLDIPAGSSDDDFFDLGGDSLLAVGLIERIEARLDIEFPLDALFVEGTLGALTAACIAAATVRSEAE
jgi:acyl carrier protein